MNCNLQGCPCSKFLLLSPELKTKQVQQKSIEWIQSWPELNKNTCVLIISHLNSSLNWKLMTTNKVVLRLMIKQMYGSLSHGTIWDLPLKHNFRFTSILVCDSEKWMIAWPTCEYECKWVVCSCHHCCDNVVHMSTWDSLESARRKTHELV